MLNELKTLRKMFIAWAVVLFVLVLVFFFFPIDTPFSALILKYMETDLLPEGVSLVVLTPWSAFVAQIIVAVGLSFAVSSPLLLYSALRFIMPAMYPQERAEVMKVLFPSIFLFLGGCAFAYFVMLPPMFRILYAYALPIGAVTFFSVSDFINFSFGIMFATGAMFLLPIIMMLLTKVGIVDHGFWKRQWRWATVITLLFSAIITPDGSGVGMAILSTPLLLLYVLGVYISRPAKKGKD